MAGMCQGKWAKSLRVPARPKLPNVASSATGSLRIVRVLGRGRRAAFLHLDGLGLRLRSAGVLQFVALEEIEPILHHRARGRRRVRGPEAGVLVQDDDDDLGILDRREG